MRIGRWIAAGVGIAAMGAAAVYAQYRQTEEPEFAVVSADADFELRDYPSLVVAEVSHSGSRERASGASFRRLAAYIFAQDRPAGGESIAMTAPVEQSAACAVAVEAGRPHAYAGLCRVEQHRLFARRVAHAGVGAALAGGGERERAGALDRDPDRQGAGMGLEILLEGRVVLTAEALAVRRYLDAVAAERLQDRPVDRRILAVHRNAVADRAQRVLHVADLRRHRLHVDVLRPAREVNGRFFIDETVLREAGMTDFSGYAVDPTRPLLPDFFLDDPELEEALRR